MSWNYDVQSYLSYHDLDLRLKIHWKWTSEKIFFQDTFIINSFLLLLPKLTLYGDYFMIHTHAAINLPENCIVVNGLKDS